MLNYEIIKSGSSGNCVVIENIMIDIGVPYTTIREYLFDVDYLLITHIHSDHLKESTYKRIREMFPNIITISNWQVAQKLKGDVDYVINWQEFEEFENLRIEAFEAIHDVVNNGYVIKISKDNEEYNVIYCTDSSNYSNAPTDDKYDYLFLESNHDEQVINAIKNPKKQYGYNVKVNASRHCSEQRAKAFYYTNRRDEESEFIELHKSERFYR